MKQNDRKQPSTLTVVICVLLFVAVATAILSSGIISPNAGGATIEQMDINNQKDIIFKQDGTTYKMSLNEQPEEIDENSLKELPGNQIGDILRFGENNKFTIQTSDKGFYFKAEEGSQYKLEGENIDINSISFSANGKAFMAMANGKLYTYRIKNDVVSNYTEVDTDVDNAHFTVNNDYVYQKGNSIIYSSGGYKSEIENNGYFLTATKDTPASYYIVDYDEFSGGVLVRYQVGGKKSVNGDVVIDENVTDLFYIGADHLMYIKNGTLHVANGVETENLEIKADEFIKDLTY